MRVVLIVEDNERNMKLVRDILRAKGYDTLEAVTGEDGVALAKERLPDLVLMDIQLPGMNGLELTRRLKADEARRHIVIVALTAYAMKGDDEKARAAGCDGYLARRPRRA